MRFARRIRLRLLRRSACAALAGAIFASVLPALAVGPDDPCRTSACKAKVEVGDSPVRWRSIETFYPHNERLVVRLKAKGRKLRRIETWGPRGCRAAYAGRGIAAIVNSCGQVTPLGVRAVRLKRPSITLVIVYRAKPLLAG